MGFRSLNAMKCVYIGFSLSKQQSFFWKISLNSCLIGLDQLYTGRAGGSSMGKGFNNIFSTIFPVCSLGLVVTIWTSTSKFPSSITGRTYFSSLLFFSFSFRWVFFLVIAVLFCFFISPKIVRFINFLLYCLILSFPLSPSRGPAIYTFLVQVVIKWRQKLVRGWNE